MQWIYFALICLVAGCVASLIFRPSGGSMLVNLVIGVVGAFLGAFLFQVFRAKVCSLEPIAPAGGP